MSVNLALGGIPGNPVTVTLATGEGDVFAPSADGSPLINVLSLSVCNTDASARIVDLYWNDGTTSFQFFKKSVPANESVVVTDILIPLTPSAVDGGGVAKKIRGKAAAGSVVVVTVHYSTIMAQRSQLQ